MAVRNFVEEIHHEALARRREAERRATATKQFQDVVFSAATEPDPALCQVCGVSSDS